MNNQHNLILEIMTDENRKSELLSLVSKASREGSLKEINDLLIATIRNEPNLKKKLGSRLEAEIFATERHPLLHKPLKISKNYGRRYIIKGQKKQRKVDHISFRFITENMLRWIGEGLSDEFSTPVNDLRAKERRLHLLQLQSALKYTEGNRMGLLELLEYPKGVTPIVQWILLEYSYRTKSVDPLLFELITS